MGKAARWGGLLLGVAASAPLGAQQLSTLCESTRKMSVGQWASYTVTGGKANGDQMRFAIVGTEKRGDSTLYWFEISHKGADAAQNGVMQMLVPNFDAQGGGIRGMIMKMGAQPAMRMPEQMISMMGQRSGQNPALEITRRCLAAQVIGTETVSVPAGSMSTLHLKGSDGGEAWMSSDVPFGIVKVITKDNATMVLTGRGMDAKSSITETPQEMPMMPGMNR